jgi:hypothetical protein
MPDAPRASILNTLGWGAYLACSWTWCIGMFLPVLLIRDFGWWSFPVFAIPNCVGAAAMGWVMKKPGSSEQTQAAHAAMVRAFSWVTVLFQACFLFWLTRSVARDQVYSLAVPGLMFMVGLLAAILPRSSSRRAITSVIVFLTSVAFGAVWWNTTPTTQWLNDRFPLDTTGLTFLAPVVAFGFLFSPYLDATFHRAAHDSDPLAPRAFGLGFLVLFPIMIGLTALYAPTILSSAVRGEFGSARPTAVPALIAAHIALQLGFTIGAHPLGSTQRRDPSKPLPTPMKYLLLLVPFASALLTSIVRVPHDIGELIYRLFMSFYGLVFPAYVWICMIPTLRSPTKPTRRQLAVWLIAITLAAPFYYLGFIELQYWALAPGVLIPLVARFAIGPRSANTRLGSGLQAQ